MLVSEDVKQAQILMCPISCLLPEGWQYLGLWIMGPSEEYFSEGIFGAGDSVRAMVDADAKGDEDDKSRHEAREV